MRNLVGHIQSFFAATVMSLSRQLIVIGAVGLTGSALLTAQNALLQQKLADAKRSAAENRKKLHQYRWVETTQITLKGDPKPSTQSTCQYGPDGRVEKTPMGSPPPPPSGGRFKQRMVERKKEELKDYMEQVKSILTLYVPPDPQRMQQAYQAGKVAINPAGDSVNLIFNDYAQPGDKMTLAFDTVAKKIRSVDVNTYVGEEKDAVTMRAEMASLPDGTSYASQTVLNAAAKQLVVTTTNSNYQKIAGY